MTNEKLIPVWRQFQSQYRTAKDSNRGPLISPNQRLAVAEQLGRAFTGISNAVEKNISGILPVGQTVCIQIRTDLLTVGPYLSPNYVTVNIISRRQKPSPARQELNTTLKSQLYNFHNTFVHVLHMFVTLFLQPVLLSNFYVKNDQRRDVSPVARKPVFVVHCMLIIKAQTSLRIRAVWSAPFNPLYNGYFYKQCRLR